MELKYSVKNGMSLLVDALTLGRFFLGKIPDTAYFVKVNGKRLSVQADVRVAFEAADDHKIGI